LEIEAAPATGPHGGYRGGPLLFVNSRHYARSLSRCLPVGDFSEKTGFLCVSVYATTPNTSAVEFFYNKLPVVSDLLRETTTATPIIIHPYRDP
jgi:hypothetical protein